MSQKVIKDIYRFTDYRKYLQHYYTVKKRTNKRFSYQMMAQKAGLNRSFLYNIINAEENKRKNLSKLNIEKLVNALKNDHSLEEIEFFRKIVAYTQTPEDKIEDRIMYLNQAQQIIINNGIRHLTKDESAYFTRWYHSAICSLIEFIPVGENFEQMSSILLSRVTPNQVKNSIALLKRLGLIVRNDDGYYHRTEGKIIKTGMDIPQAIKDQYHIAYTEIAKMAIRNTPPDSRYVISNTLGISEETYIEIKKEIVTFRNALRRLIDKDKGTDRIYQLQILLYPLSETRTKGTC